VQAACRAGGTRRVKVETVERLCRKVLGTDPRSLYGEAFERAWQHRGKRVNERVQAFDHCFCSPKSVSLLAAGGGDQIRKQVAETRAEALDVGIRYLERHGIGVRRDHNGTDRHHVHTGVLAVAFEHRMSRAGDPNAHTHVLVQNAAHGPDGRWTALDSDRLYAQLMAADHLYLAAERAALTERLGVRWEPVDARSGAAEIVGLDDRRLIERFSKRSEQIHEWLAEQGLSGIKASSAAAVATRAPKDHSEPEQSVYARWARELAEQGVGERRLAEVCRGERGRPATENEVRRVLEELAGPEGLTAEVTWRRRPGPTCPAVWCRRPAVSYLVSARRSYGVCPVPGSTRRGPWEHAGPARPSRLEWIGFRVACWVPERRRRRLRRLGRRPRLRRSWVDRREHAARGSRTWARLRLGCGAGRAELLTDQGGQPGLGPLVAGGCPGPGTRDYCPWSLSSLTPEWTGLKGP
jgi:conjugative relaxase-like TrwC/TraI family protein